MLGSAVISTSGALTGLLSRRVLTPQYDAVSTGLALLELRSERRFGSFVALEAPLGQ
jgi:hypothetical protein